MGTVATESRRMFLVSILKNDSSEMDVNVRRCVGQVWYAQDPRIYIFKKT